MEWVKTHDEESYGEDLFQFSNNFLNILAVPNNIVFWKGAVFSVISSFSNHSSNFLIILLSAPTIIGITITFLMFQILLIFLFKILVFLDFSFSLSLVLLSQQYQRRFLFILLYSWVCQVSITLLHWIFTSHSGLISSFSTTPSGENSCHFFCLFYFVFLT